MFWCIFWDIGIVYIEGTSGYSEPEWLLNPLCEALGLPEQPFWRTRGSGYGSI